MPGFFSGNMPYLVTMPSCKLYLRGANGSNILDWSPVRRAITVTGSVTNSATNAIFPPASLLFDGSTGYQLEISRYTADKYITCNPSLKYLYLDMIAGESQNDQVWLATKKALYPYTEDNPQVWYPGWAPQRVPALAYL